MANMQNMNKDTALRLAEELDDGYPLTGDAISAAAELRSQHARITALESQLAQRFDAADMATAAAQGFRDGAAKEQQAGAFQAALDIRTAQGWKLGGDKVPVLYTDEINGQQVCRDDVWLCTTDAFTHPYPPEGMAGWTTQPVAEQTKSADMSDEREAFEAWLRSIWSAGYGCPKFDSGKYVHHEAQRFWECWQASASHGQAPAETGNSVSAQADSVLEDAARYRWLAASCRSTSEHWGGRWSIVVEGPAPKSHDSEDDFDAAIDAGRKQGANHD